MKRSKIFLLTFVVLCLTAPVSFAHSGGTNAEGCHTNRKTGDYHCHSAKTPAPNAVTYCHVVQGERRCGYAKSSCDDLRNKFGGYCERD